MFGYKYLLRLPLKSLSRELRKGSIKSNVEISFKKENCQEKGL